MEFYTSKLGFQILTDQPFDGQQRWIELGIKGASTRLVLFTPEEHRDRIGTFTHVTFLADDVQQTYDQLLQKGVEFVQPPDVQEWGTAAVFKDSEGNVFVLSSR